MSYKPLDEEGFWKTGDGREIHISDIKDQHLINIYCMLRKKKEKDMAFIEIRNEVRRRKLDVS